jgi:hypothetical protein
MSAFPPVPNRQRRRRTVAAALLAALGPTMLPTVPAWGDPGPAAAGPGYVIMIHSTAEPHSHPVADNARSGNVTVDQAKTGVLYASGAVTATNGADSIVFRAIPYRADTVYPVVVRNPRLEVTEVGGGRRLMLEPNRPAGGPICRAETGWAGHEGPIEACSVYEVPVAAFHGMNVVTLTLHFTDQQGPQHRVHNFPAHFMLHMAIEGIPVDLKAIDAATTEPTPLVVETLIETKSF